MAYRAVSGRRVRALTAALVALVCLLAGCTYDAQEPGLFPRATGTPTPTSIPTPSSEPPATPSLPVVGDAVWTSGDGFDVTVRWAVHAIRRMPGATVLDWSVTPISGPGLRPGDRLPPELDLGLTTNGQGYDNVSLLDVAGGRVYRPLTRRGSVTHACLCTRTSSVGGELRLGRTTVLQTTYPVLPAKLAFVEVDISTVPPFAHVPVSPVDRLPRATLITDLARPVTSRLPAATSQEFAYRPGYQRFVITVDGVYVSDTFTSVAWSIESVTSGLGLQLASQPPFSDAKAPDRGYNRLSAGGPQAIVSDRGQPPLRNRLGVPNRARVTTARLDGARSVQCLCTDLRVWTSTLQRAGQRISVVTNLPPLEIGYSGLDIVLPRVQTLQDVGVSAAPDSAHRSAGTVAYRPTSWEMPSAMPHPAWSTTDWPTPLPIRDQLRDYASTVDRIVR